MTSVASFLAIPTFRVAIDAFLNGAPALDEDYRNALGSGATPDPTSTAEGEQQRIVRALSVTYDIAANEGVDEVLNDIRVVYPDLSSENEGRLRAIISPSLVVTERLEGMRLRDGFLPVLTSWRFALDLRFVEIEDQKRLLPLVTARLSFDEPVGVLENAVFQVPLEALSGLAVEIAELVEKVANLPRDLATAVVPSWSIEGVLGEHA